MNHDAILRDLAAERVGDLLPILRRAFETGYREGMAAVGMVVAGTVADQQGSEGRGDSRIALDQAPVADSEAPVEDLEAVVAVPETVAANGDADDVPDDEEDDELLEESTPGDGEPSRKVFRGIRASATVGGLLKKIERVFRLEERFDLVVRVESPGSGRALKRNTRLSVYAREG